MVRKFGDVVADCLFIQLIKKNCTGNPPKLISTMNETLLRDIIP